MNIPKLFEDRMRALLGEEYEEYLQCYSQPHYVGLRVNTLKITPEEFERICPFTITRIPWIRNGYYYDRSEQPARHPYYYAGLYYIQEPSAMTPASLLPIEKGDKVLDLCAAPGGKSTELGARLKGTGLLVSNDISNSRAKALLKNIELFGIRNALVLSEAPNKLVQYFPEYFDKILIDAPCSGEGMFRKSPVIMKNWEQYGVEYYNKLQKEIILYAAKMLKPGGTMLYSTCTFSPEEDEGTIAYLLEEFPEFQVIPALPEENHQREQELSYEGFDFGKPEWIQHGSEQLRNCIRLWPHKIKGEGHFIALLKKNGTVFNHEIYEQPNGNDRKRSVLSEEALSFIEELNHIHNKKCFNNNDDYEVDQKNDKDEINQKNDKDAMIKKELFSKNQLVVREDKVYYMPKGLPDLKGLRILRQGLLLGEMKKQRFEPSQALASALKSEEYEMLINLDSSDPNVIRYLKCETIEPESLGGDGWYLICVDGHPLGWSKIARENFKNKYLPGWRWM